MLISDRECVRVLWERERVCVCLLWIVREWGRKRECVRVCVCECLKVRVSERERECVRDALLRHANNACDAGQVNVRLRRWCVKTLDGRKIFWCNYHPSFYDEKENVHGDKPISPYSKEKNLFYVFKNIRSHLVKNLVSPPIICYSRVSLVLFGTPISAYFSLLPNYWQDRFNSCDKI